MTNGAGTYARVNGIDLYHEILALMRRAQWVLPIVTDFLGTS